MKISEVETILQRADRFRKKLQIKEGDGAKWSYNFEDGDTHFYTIEGVRPPEEIEDYITSVFTWLWSVKDYVKKYVVEKGKNGNWVEDKVNSDFNLCICADIANSLKHGGIDPKRRPRSGKNIKLYNLEYVAPKEAIGIITVGAYDVSANIINPSLMDIKMPIYDENNEYIDDALNCLDHVLKAWKNIIEEAEVI